jgi:hypothetical protein
VRERGEGANERQGRGGLRFLSSEMSSVYGGLRRKRLAVADGFWGRRRALSAGSRGRASVAGRFGRGW